MESPQPDPMFAPLDEAQIARLMPFGEQRQAQAHEIIFDQGDATHGVFIVLEGSVEILSISTGGEDLLRIVDRCIQFRHVDVVDDERIS